MIKTIIEIIGAVVLLVTSGFSTYYSYLSYHKSYEIDYFQLKLNEHSEISNSYIKRMKLAKNDKEKTERIKTEFDNFEQNWGSSKLLSLLLNNARNFGLDKISQPDKDHIFSIYNFINCKLYLSNLEIADIEYLSGNYQSASTNYLLVLEKDPKNITALEYGLQALNKASENDPNYKPSTKELKQYKNFINNFGKNIKNDMEKDKLIQRSNELKNIENKYFSKTL